MTLDYSVKDKSKITIMDYINGMMEFLDKAEPKAISTKSSAASLNMFVVDEDCEETSKEKYEIFHKLVANMLFSTKKSAAGYWYSHILPGNKSKRARLKRFSEDGTSIQVCHMH